MSDPNPQTGAPMDDENAEVEVGGFLGWVERLGNKLPDPATLFLIGTIGVMLLSHLAVMLDWSVGHELPRIVVDDDGVATTRWEPKVTQESLFSIGDEGQVVETKVDTAVQEVSRPRSLLTPDGLYWLLSSLVRNFMNFPPLGVVLVGMLGIGLAERVGLVAVLLKYLMRMVPNQLLTPAMVFLGIMSSMGIDAGYVVLPPLAAALYLAVGRSPVAGIAAVFAGVAAGFNANLFITGLDPMLAKFTTTGAQVIDANYEAAPTCNWWFAIASTLVITLVGWWVTAMFVERRLKKLPPSQGGPTPVSREALASQEVSDEERDALKWAAGALGGVFALVLVCTLVPGWPLNGKGTNFARWVEAIVPLLFLAFTIPSIVYGVRIKTIRNDKEAAKMLVEAIAAMAPIIVLSFFAAQFIEAFKYSGLDKMAALAGGQALGKAEMSKELLVVAFIGVTILFNLFVGSMSAKYAMFAPIFVPMFMLVGISPELTQAAYRIGDSVSNTITPLNAYLVIVLVFLRQVMPKAGMGTLVSTMLPYTIVFSIMWTLLLLAWMALGWPLGLEGPLDYEFTR